MRKRRGFLRTQPLAFKVAREAARFLTCAVTIGVAGIVERTFVCNNISAVRRNLEVFLEYSQFAFSFCCRK